MFCRFCGKQNKEGARFCTGCGKLLEEEEAGSAWREPAKESVGKKQASPGKLLFIIAGVLGAAALVAVIFLAVEIFRTDKGGSFKETDIEQDREETAGTQRHQTGKRAQMRPGMRSRRRGIQGPQSRRYGWPGMWAGWRLMRKCRRFPWWPLMTTIFQNVWYPGRR